MNYTFGLKNNLIFVFFSFWDSFDSLSHCKWIEKNGGRKIMPTLFNLTRLFASEQSKPVSFVHASSCIYLTRYGRKRAVQECWLIRKCIYFHVQSQIRWHRFACISDKIHLLFQSMIPSSLCSIVGNILNDECSLVVSYCSDFPIGSSVACKLIGHSKSSKIKQFGVSSNCLSKLSIWPVHIDAIPPESDQVIIPMWVRCCTRCTLDPIVEATSKGVSNRNGLTAESMNNIIIIYLSTVHWAQTRFGVLERVT